MTAPIPSYESPVPFDFALTNRWGQTALYTRLLPQSQQLILNIWNTSRTNFTIGIIEAKDKTPAKASAQQYHFALRFRSGTLWLPDKDPEHQLALSSRSKDIWDMEHIVESDGADVYYFRYVAGDPLTIPSKNGQSSTPTGTESPALPLILENIAVDGRGGSRGTRVELEYQNLYRSAGSGANGEKPLSGKRMHYISVLDESPADEPCNVPIRIGWVGPNTFLNDGTTPTTRVLRLLNQTGRDLDMSGATISLTPSVGKSSWDLLEKEDPANFKVTDVKQYEPGSEKPDGTWQPSTTAELKKGILEITTPPPAKLKDKGYIDIPITVVASPLFGQSYIIVRYGGFGHLQDTQRLAVIKTPMVVTADSADTACRNVGIGTCAPDAKLHVLHSGSKDALRVEQKGTGNSARFTGKGGVNIDGVSGKNNALKIECRLAAGTPALLVDQKGIGYAARFKGTAGVNISGAIMKNTGLTVKSKNTKKTPALLVEQEGAGNAARFTGKGGVDIDGVSGKNNGLKIEVDTENSYPALEVTQKGESQAVFIEANSLAPALRVWQAGTGCSAILTGEGGVLIDGVGGGNNGLKVNCATDNKHSGLHVEQSGAGPAAKFKGKGGVSIDGVGGGNNGLKVVCDTDNKYSGLRVEQVGTGAAALFEGHVGIGTTDPQAPLHVFGGSLKDTFKMKATVDTADPPRWIDEDKYGFSPSIIAEKRIRAAAFDSNSDARIKNIIGQSSGVSDVHTLLAMEITDFRYKDVVGKGNASHKKVIAQQVEKVYPQAVYKSTDVVPDIYEKATMKDGWVELATDLKVGERVRLIGEKEEAIHEVLEVRDGAFRTAFNLATDEIFVYGREVNDYRSVDYDAIAMLNVSATQELARRLETKDGEIAALRQQLNEQAARLERFEARLASLEKTASTADAPELVAELI